MIKPQPDRPTLGIWEEVEAAKNRLMSDGGTWEIDPILEESAK